MKYLNIIITLIMIFIVTVKSYSRETVISGGIIQGKGFHTSEEPFEESNVWLIDLATKRNNKPRNHSEKLNGERKLTAVKEKAENYYGGRKINNFRIILMEGEAIYNPAGNSENVPVENFPSACAEKYIPIVNEICCKYGIDPGIIMAMIKIESGFNPDACSSMNAMGLMQIIPETAKALNLQDPYDPYENIDAGVRYFKAQLERFGDLEMALAAYNAGPGAVEKYNGIPPYEETRNYVRMIVNLYNCTMHQNN